MATVFRRPNSKYWWAQYFDSTGKRVAKSTKSEKKREAEKIAADMESEDRKRASLNYNGKAFAGVIEVAARDADAGSLTLQRAEELLERLKKLANPNFRESTLREAWDQWRSNQEVGEATAKGYSEDQKLLAGALGEKAMEAPVSSLTTTQLKAAIKKAALTQGGKGRAGKPRKAATVNKALASLRRALEWAKGQSLIPHNPADDVKPLPENDSDEKGPFSEEEAIKILEASLEEPNDEWEGAILNASQAGLRMGDIVKLSDAHVDGARFVIRPAKTSRTKKTIVVPISEDIRLWMKGRKGLFFPTIAAMSSPERSMKFAKIMERAGVSKTITAPGGIVLHRTFHSLRHTFTSWLADAGVAAEVRQKLTGHSSSRTHQRYTHHDKALDKAVESLPRLRKTEA